MHFRISKGKWWSITALILLLAAAFTTSRIYYGTPTAESSATVTERQYYVICHTQNGDGTLPDSIYAVILPRIDTIAYDTLLALPTDTQFLRSITRHRPATWINRWWYPSCHGRLASRIDTLHEPLMPPLPHSTVLSVLHTRLDAMQRLLATYQSQQSEIDYFIHSHDVQDEGFDVVTRRREYVSRHIDSLTTLIRTVQRMAAAKATAIHHRTIHTVLSSGTPCREIPTYRKGYKLFQTVDHTTPEGIRPVYLHADSIGYGENTSRHITAPADTVIIGTRTKDGNYHGAVQLYCRNGSYYEGEIVEGKRQGFGVGFDTNVRAGQWKANHYQGEQPVYSANHIYGIDISRYQHEKGRKRFSINWKNLRITSLGTLSRKRINGNVNYPISFIYIKCTEGTTIRNRYFPADYKQSHKYGYKTGAYHFYSTRTPAKQQAYHFLRYYKYHKGDLPPVLDVEPSPAQVRQMGGSHILLRNVRLWMELVEQHIGVRPILYVSQSFVNRYLADKNNYIKQNYQVWIARYGEYKPDVHLIYWQLCPDGRVSGIQTPVDINIFNGYEQAFREFAK